MQKREKILAAAVAGLMAIVALWLGAKSVLSAFDARRTTAGQLSRKLEEQQESLEVEHSLPLDLAHRECLSVHGDQRRNKMVLGTTTFRQSIDDASAIRRVAVLAHLPLAIEPRDRHP